MPESYYHVNTPVNSTQIFNQYRALLFSIAYRMLCSAASAEDSVQEAFLRWLQASIEEINEQPAIVDTWMPHLSLSSSS